MAYSAQQLVLQQIILQCYRSGIIGVLYFSLEYLRNKRDDFYVGSCRSTDFDSPMLY